MRFRGDVEGKVTAIRVFDDGAAVQRPCVRGGEIGQVWGLRQIQIGDAIGELHGTTIVASR